MTDRGDQQTNGTGRRAVAPLWRRRVYLLSAVALAVLCAFPQPYVARAKVLPQDPGSIGLVTMTGAAGTQFPGLAALFGGSRSPVDLYLAIARSSEVQNDAVGRLGSGLDRAALERQVDIHSLNGGIIEVEVHGHDPKAVRALTRAYVAAMSDRIVALASERAEARRKAVAARFPQGDSSLPADQAIDAAAAVQVIEAPRLDPDRKYNVPAAALLLLVVLAAAFTELYAPATGLSLSALRRRGEAS